MVSEVQEVQATLETGIKWFLKTKYLQDFRRNEAKQVHTHQHNNFVFFKVP